MSFESDRRAFLVSGLAGAVAAGCRASAAPLPPATPGDWAALKAEFDRLAPDKVHMSAFFLVSHSRGVRAAIEQHQRGLDDDPFDYIEANVARLEVAARGALAEYTGTRSDDLVMTSSTTNGLGIVFGGLRLVPGQTILTTTHDHIVMRDAIANRASLCAPTRVERIALYDDPAKANETEIVARLERAITPATRAIGVTWVHSGTGVKLPLRAIADAVARANRNRAEGERALLIVDGVHGIGNQEPTVAALGVDFFIAGCHKWLFGPRGTGFVWSRAWSAVDPIQPTMEPMWRPEPPDKMPPSAYRSPGGFIAFEHRWALPAAFEIHERFGRATIAARIRELATRCKTKLAAIPRVRVVTPMAPELSAGIICFEIERMAPQAVVEALHAKKIVASMTPPFYTPMYARLAPSLLTLEGDVDRAVDAVAAIART